MNLQSTIRSITLGCLVLVGAGCTVGPDYVKPEIEVVESWREDPRAGLVSGAIDVRAWWQRFGDPKLDDLVERAIAGNLDLRQAVSRIEEARGRFGVAEGELFPQIEGAGSYSRFSTSKNIGLGRETDDRLSIGLNSAWEIDVFGRIRRSVEAASAALDFAAEDYGDVLVSLTSDLAINYVRLRALQKRVAIAEANAESQRESLRLARSRLSAGLVPALDVAQAETNLANTDSTIPDLRAAIKLSIHRIGVLLGEQPQLLRDELATPGETPTPPAEVAVGVPGEVVFDRPDVRRAERALASQTALIGVATADLYPRFSLNGFISLDADSVADWFEGGSRAFSAGPAMHWNIFTGGIIRNRIRVEEARTEQALLAYRQSVLIALEEVENSMVTYIERQNQRDALARAEEAASRSSRLASTLYRDGLSDFQNVLDSQRSRLDFEDALAEAEGEVTINLILLFRSLGGGWAAPSDGPEADDVTAPGSGE